MRPSREPCAFSMSCARRSAACSAISATSARGQAERGHAVGLIADSVTGGAPAEAALAALAPQFSLGIERFPIARNPGPSDLIGVLRLRAAIRRLQPDIVHGHGAKGGAFARLAAIGERTIRAYTPHGGSLHYRPGTPARRDLRNDGTAADAAHRSYSCSRATMRAGPIWTTSALRTAWCASCCNGVGAADLAPIHPAKDATDLVFVGELRRLKGVDVLLYALALLR